MRTALTLSCFGASIVLGAAAFRSQAGADRIWSPSATEDVYDVSPDGRYLAYIDWETGNLMTRDLQTNTARNLTNKGTYQTSGDEADNGVFSRGGNVLSYEWWDSKTRTDELRIINSDGTGVRTIYREAKVSAWPTDFTPDGKSILTILSDEKGRRIALVPIDGGKPRVLKTNIGRGLAPLISPDGRFVVFGSGDGKDDFRRDIFAISLADGREWTVVENAADDYPVGWSRDGSHLVFASDRGGSPGIWSQLLTNGRPDGTPSLVRGDLWRMQGIRMTREGRFFYHVSGGDRDVFTAPIDLVTGRLQAPPVSVTAHPGEAYSEPQWSPDGRHIAYLKREASGVRHTLLEIRSADGDEVRQFLPKFFGPNRPAWVLGSQTLAINGVDKDGHATLFGFDLRTGAATPLVLNTISITASSRDGRTMYYVPRHAAVDTASRLVARDVASGRERTLYVDKHGGRINANAVTADGNWVILVWTAKLAPGSMRPLGTFAVSARTGEMRNLGVTIPIDSAHETMRHIGFTPDQKSVVMMVQRTDSMSKFALWRAPIDGGPAVKLPNAPAELERMAAGGSWISPDGRRILFLTGKQVSEVWALDIPVLRAAR